MTLANTNLITLGEAFAKEQGLNEAPQQALPLHQAWLSTPTPELRPATALLYPRNDGLHVVVTMEDKDIFNNATGPNQKTWQLGDVVEIFIGVSGQEKYWELHVTPDNHILQLEWTQADLAAYRSKEVPLADYLVNDLEFFRSNVSLNREKQLWQVHAFIPWSSVGLPTGASAYTLDFAVCRYDLSRDANGQFAEKDTTYASTANLSALNYHLRHNWHTIRLCP